MEVLLNYKAVPMPFLGGVLSVMDERSPCIIPITQEKEIKDDKVLLYLLSPSPFS